MKKFLFTTLAFGLMAVSANAAATAKNDLQVNAKTGCYEISSADDLDGFAQNVVNAGATNACAELTTNIYYNGKSEIAIKNCLKSDYSGVTCSGLRVWTPIGEDNSNPFVGIFDGKGYSIYGLYLERQWEPAFVKKAAGGAFIKNLTIKDSYFLVKQGGGDGGGFIGDIPKMANNSLDVTIDRCGFEGYIYAEASSGKKTFSGNDKNAADKDGGLVGSVGEGASLIITNSYNSGVITGPDETTNGKSGLSKVTYEAPKHLGGLVGYVNKGSYLNMTNCYNSGEAKNNPLIGGTDSKSGDIKGKDVGCVGTSSDGKCNANYGESSLFANTNVEEVINHFNENLKSVEYQSESVSENFDAEVLTEILGEELAGVEIEDVPNPDCPESATGCKHTMTQVVILSDNETVVIPQSVKIGKVVFNREFKSGVLSSIVMPFSIKAANVTNAKFYEFAGIDKETNEEKPYWTVDIDPICSESGCGDQELQANHPYYVVKTTADEGALTFEGGVTLVATEGANLDYQGDTEEYGNEWTFKGTYSYKKWEEGNSELGSVYGQAAKDAASGNYKAGDFVKISKNSYIKAMRAYLAYSPAVVGAKKRALAKTIASVEELPKTMVYRIRPYKGQESIENPEVEEGSEEKGTLGMTKAVKVPSSLNIMDRWYDSKGRCMNKPNSQGAFIKNGTPVIVK